MIVKVNLQQSNPCHCRRPSSHWLPIRLVSQCRSDASFSHLLLKPKGRPISDLPGPTLRLDSLVEVTPQVCAQPVNDDCIQARDRFLCAASYSTQSHNTPHTTPKGISNTCALPLTLILHLHTRRWFHRLHLYFPRSWFNVSHPPCSHSQETTREVLLRTLKQPKQDKFLLVPHPPAISDPLHFVQLTERSR